MNKLFCILISILMSFAFISCHEDIPLEEQENAVTFKVFANEDEYLTLHGLFWDKSYLEIKSGWEYTFKTKENSVQLLVTCENEHTLITVEIYKNNKLIERKDGNSWLNVGATLK